jgi:transposase-like protein
MTDNNDNPLSTIMEQLISEGPEGMARVLTTLFNMAMKLDRDRYLQANAYERTENRIGFANGYQSKKIDTPMGTLNVAVPKSAGAEKPFYPACLERGMRSSRAVMLAAAEMYILGVSTRDVEKVMAQFGLESLSSSQVSRAMALLDEDLKAWRNRSLGETPYLFMDARYEKVRVGGIGCDVAVLTAFGVAPDGSRRILGVSVALSEAEVHWRAFLESLVARGLRGVRFITSDAHAGLNAARKAVLGGAIWQRCQFHLGQNAIHHCPTQKIKKKIGGRLRKIWNSEDLPMAQEELASLVEKYRKKAPKLAEWLEKSIPEGFAVFTLPEKHRIKMRTANPIERAIQLELARRTNKIPIFPNEASLLRLVTAILVEIDEKWATNNKSYINWNTEET